MSTSNQQKLVSHFKPGHVYRRQYLSQFSTAVDRNLMTLVKKGVLEKVGAGLYHRPTMSRFGVLRANDTELVKSFLKENHFLMVSWNLYNTLGLGLSQLYNKSVVYNRKRHGLFILSNKTFDFRHTSRGFPKILTPEFLLVDLLNNLSELDEDATQVKANITKQLYRFNVAKVLKCANEYGKIATKHFLKEICH